MSSRKITVLLLLSGIYVGAITISNVIAVKLIDIGGFVLPASIISFSITFTLTDVIGEIWGKKIAQSTVIAGVVTNILVLTLVKLAIIFPPAQFWNNQAEFNLVLNSSIRIILSSITAFLISQTLDVQLFHFIKKITNGKHLWLRNNISTILSQLADQVIFILLAFYGTVPHEKLLPLILYGYVGKLIVAVLDTPVVYVLVKLINKRISHE